MGIALKNKANVSSKKVKVRGIRVVKHEDSIIFTVLSKEDVEKGRSSAYKYVL